VPVAAFSLGQIHGGVGGPQQGVRILGIFRIQADADARRDLQSMALQKIGRGDGSLDLECDGVGASVPANRFENDHELVPADAGDRVAVADGLRESLGDGVQQQITDLVPVRVVHALEAIDIHEQDGKGHT
jgi:hypothetical protein